MTGPEGGNDGSGGVFEAALRMLRATLRAPFSGAPIASTAIVGAAAAVLPEVRPQELAPGGGTAAPVTSDGGATGPRQAHAASTEVERDARLPEQVLSFEAGFGAGPARIPGSEGTPGAVLPRGIGTGVGDMVDAPVVVAGLGQGFDARPQGAADPFVPIAPERPPSPEVEVLPPPQAIATPQRGVEDVPVALSLNLSELALDAIIVVTGLPEGSGLTEGQLEANGAWTLTLQEAARVLFVPPGDWSGHVTLQVMAIERDKTGVIVARAEDLPVTVLAVADAPVVSVAEAAGHEDGWIALDLSAALADRDGSETLGLRLLGLPEGAVLSAGLPGADGSWTLLRADLPGLALRPPSDFAGRLDLTLEAVATEADGGDTATTTASFVVAVEAVVDGGSLSGSGSGSEDSWIALSASFGALTDASERWGPDLRVEGVPEAGALSHGERIAPGVWTVSREIFEAGDLSILPPPNSDFEIALRITATVFDGDVSGTTSFDLTVDVRGITDTPEVWAQDATGAEDTSIRLAGLGGALLDTDGSESLSFTLSGVPAGAMLSHGVLNTDGTWRLSPGEVAAVRLTPPTHFSGRIALTLTAIATEADPTASPVAVSVGFTVQVNPVADDGWISGWGSGREDSPIQLFVNFSTPDADGSETWSALTRVSGVPARAALTQGTEIEPGVWDVSTADLLAYRISIWPPADSDEDITLAYSATLSDSDGVTVSSRTVTSWHTITVDAVADAAIVAVADMTGDEDAVIALDLSAALSDIDGSERLETVISGVPSGAILSHGIEMSEGVWTVAAEDLPGLTLTPPQDFSGIIALRLTATTYDNNFSTATVVSDFVVRVEAVADAPALRPAAAAGFEDSAITLKITAATTDIDGSETLVGLRLSDVPDGAVVRAGDVVLTVEADGSVLVPAADMSALTLTPPPDSDADIILRVSAISMEPNGSRAESATRLLPVQVDAAADAPVWLRIGAEGVEDTTIPLDLSARLTDTDGSEVLSYVISGVPRGAVLTEGSYAGPGTWSLSAEEAATVAIIPPPDFAGTLSLTVMAVAQELNGGAQTGTSVAFDIHVSAALDTTDFTRVINGQEDAPIALDLAPLMQDLDGSERAIGPVTIAGIPDGAVLRLASGGEVLAGLDGNHVVAREDLAGLTLTLPANSDVAATLTVTQVVQDGAGVSDVITGSVTVDPLGVADEASLTIVDAAAVTHTSDVGAEAWTLLDIRATLSDIDGSETVYVWVRDLPDGFRLSAGIPSGDGVWRVAAADLNGLQIRPPSGFEGEATLTILAVVQEREADTAITAGSLTVTVSPASDEGGGGTDGGTDTGGDGAGGGGAGGDGAGGPVVSPPIVTIEERASGVEDGVVELGITVTPDNTDGGDETIAIRIEGLPGTASLTAGILDPVSGNWLLSVDELDGLSAILPPDFAGDLSLRVVATAMDEAGRSASQAAILPIHVEAVADAATISASPGAGGEDMSTPMNLVIAATDADGSETVSAIVISGLPTGARLAAADGIHDNGDGTWSVDRSAVEQVAFVPPPNRHGVFAMDVAVTVREAANGAEATTTTSVSVTILPEPDTPSATAADASGTEDLPIALDLTAALIDTDGSEVLSVVLSGLPEGTMLSRGVNNEDGSWTLKQTDLAGLTLTPPGNWSGRMELSLSAHSVERSTGEAATTRVDFAVTVAGVADTPLVDMASTASGREDVAIPIEIDAYLMDRDGSETLEVVVRGLPTGSRLSAGREADDGSWVVAGDDLPGLTLTAPPDYSGRLSLMIEVVAVEADGDRASVVFDVAVTVTVGAAADAPVVRAGDVAGLEDEWIALDLASSLSDRDGSETLARIEIAGLPEGAALSAGTRDPDGLWTLEAADLEGLMLAPPPNFSGVLALSATAVSVEGENGDEARADAAFEVTVAAVADAPILSAAPDMGLEDRPGSLNLSATLADLDGSERLGALKLTGVPEGFALSAGTLRPDGVWDLAPEDLPGLTLAPPQDWSGTVSLRLEAAAEDGPDVATAALDFTVSFAAVNDAPELVMTKPGAALAGDGFADAVGSAALADPEGDLMQGALITLGGAQDGDALTFADYLLTEAGGRAQIGDTGIEATIAPDGSIALSGVATAETYAELIDSLMLENLSPGGLAVGDRVIGVEVFDAGGASSGAQVVTLAIEPAAIADDEDPITVEGSSGDDSFVGTAADEEFFGGAGADIFSIGPAGGQDRVNGGNGHWTDTVHLEDVGGPESGDWTLRIDGDIAPDESDGAFDFDAPVSGQITFADGGQIEFIQIERITW